MITTFRRSLAPNTRLALAAAAREEARKVRRSVDIRISVLKNRVARATRISISHFAHVVYAAALALPCSSRLDRGLVFRMTGHSDH
jgi:hypothetical protein